MIYGSEFYNSIHKLLHMCIFANEVDPTLLIYGKELGFHHFKIDIKPDARRAVC